MPRAYTIADILDALDGSGIVITDGDGTLNQTLQSFDEDLSLTSTVVVLDWEDDDPATEHERQGNYKLVPNPAEDDGYEEAN